MNYGMYPQSPQAYSTYMNQVISQQLMAGAQGQLSVAQQAIMSAMQMLQQRYNIDAYQMPQMPPPSFSYGPPPWQYGGIPSPGTWQQSQQANPPGLSSPPPGWPQGTVVTQGGLIVMPDSGGTVKVFNAGAQGPNDTSKLQFTVQNNKVYDDAGKQAFDLQKGGVLKLTDGTVISSGLSDSGYQQVNVIQNNSRENIAFGSGGYDANMSQDGSSYLQGTLGTSAIMGNTFGVRVSDTGDLSFYQIKGGQDLGKVTGTGWQPDQQKLSTLVATLIGQINSGLGQRFDFTPPLNPQDYTKLINGNDLTAVLQKLNLDLNQKTGVVWNFSDLLKNAKLTDVDSMQKMLNNLAGDLSQNAPSTNAWDSSNRADLANMVSQMQNDLGKNPISEDWGSTQATVDPKDKNFLVTPPQYAPPQTSQAYGNLLGQNLQAAIASGQIPPQIAAYIAGQQGWQNQGPWANQFCGGTYNPQMSFGQQMQQVPSMWGAYNNYAAMARGLPLGASNY
jgi:hypothetical protein